MSGPAADGAARLPAATRIAAAAAAVAAGLLLAACSGEPAGPGACDPAPADVVCVDGVRLSVEVADTERERREGLSGRDSLAADHGMLFVFDTAGRHGFWMVGTTIPLDIAFADASGAILTVEPMEPLSDEVVRPDAPALYALEVNRGWFASHGVGAGDTIRTGPGL